MEPHQLKLTCPAAAVAAVVVVSGVLSFFLTRININNLGFREV